MSGNVKPKPKQNPFSDEAAQAALDYLRFQAKDAAIAKANMIYMTEYRKVVKAKCMQTSQSRSAAAQEADAYADPLYITHLEALKQAIEIHEEFYWKRIAAEATIESWRTWQANRRSEGKMQ